MVTDEIKPYEPTPTASNFLRWAKNIGTFLVLGTVVVLAVILTDISTTQDEITLTQSQGKERTFQTRAVACETLIIDNDRTFELTGNCTGDDVLKYYPPAICVMLGSPAVCGTEYEPSPYPDPAFVTP